MRCSSNWKRSIQTGDLSSKRMFPSRARRLEAHAMIRAIDSNHERVIGHKPEREVVTWCSDASVLTRYGIETVNYGPSSGPRDAENEKVHIKTLVDITKIYALAAAELCGVQ